jgi:hypothetical protein
MTTKNNQLTLNEVLTAPASKAAEYVRRLKKNGAIANVDRELDQMYMPLKKDSDKPYWQQIKSEIKNVDE